MLFELGFLQTVAMRLLRPLAAACACVNEGAVQVQND